MWGLDWRFLFFFLSHFFVVFFFFACRCSVALVPFVEKKDCLSSTELLFIPLSKISCAYLCGPFSGSSIVFNSFTYLSLLITHSRDYCSCVESLNIGLSDSSHCLLSLKIILAIRRLLAFQINFRMSLSMSTTNLVGFS